MAASCRRIIYSCSRNVKSNLHVLRNAGTFLQVRYLKTPNFRIWKDGVIPHEEQVCQLETEEPTSIWAEQPSDRYTGAEEVPDHWQFVERLLPKRLTPVCKMGHNYLPSGWKPPSETVNMTLPYFIERTKNNMLPVYYKLEPRGPREITILKNVQGEIWALEKDLRLFLERTHKKEMNTMVHEYVGYIKFKGNFVEDLRGWLLDRGY